MEANAMPDEQTDDDRASIDDGESEGPGFFTTLWESVFGSEADNDPWGERWNRPKYTGKLAPRAN